VKPLIVGYDPGTTSAVAAIDIRGELVLQESSKQLSEPRTIDQLVNTGLPVLVASDKEKTPSAVESLSSSLGTELFEPQDDLSRSRKQDLGDGDNSHERDAEAAARHAFRRNRSRFRKLKRKARDSDKQPEDLVAREFLGLETGTDTTQHNHTESSGSTTENNLRSRIGELETENQDLREKIDDLKQGRLDSEVRQEEIRRMERKAVRAAGENQRLKQRLDDRREEIEQLRHALTQSQDSEVIPVFDGGQPTDRCVTESRERAQELRENGINARHIDDVDGERLAGFVVCDEFPELKVEEMLG
jgi:Uncharacterized conserved protein